MNSTLSSFKIQKDQQKKAWGHMKGTIKRADHESDTSVADPPIVSMNPRYIIGRERGPAWGHPTPFILPSGQAVYRPTVYRYFRIVIPLGREGVYRYTGWNTEEKILKI